MMYSFGIFLYALVVRLLALLGHKKARLMVRGHRAAWRLLQTQIEPGQRYVWFHAASLGEFEQGRPLMERLRREQPDRKILLTFFSPSGYEVRKDYDGADLVCYLPFDTPLNARRFIRLAQPEMAVLIKYEFWRNYIHRLHRREIPVYSVSSIFRPEQVFFRWYGRGYARCLRRITHFFVQNEESIALLQQVGVKDKVSVVGDTRMDRVVQIRQAARPLPLVEKFARGHRVIVAGSTWPPDEALLFAFLERHEDWRLVIAPHVVSEAHLSEIEAALPGRHLRLSEAESQDLSRYRTLIVDGYGMLSSIYRYATVAYVGGGFGVGIHNVPEAAVYGVPVVIGPNNQRFREARELIACGGCVEVHTAEDFEHTLQHWEEQPETLAKAGEAAGHYILRNAGAADKVYEHIFPPQV
ncbi:MAG: glycosyltransferase N-terminal domain-containing protein [Bacteroidales bacterium]|nr:glycosyltransferase N-terminal domain-containing protein [Bacteroidales bacterium]